MLLFLSACATINAVQPGPATGEFYVHVARWPFRRGEVLRCVAFIDGDRTQTRCQRALTSGEAAELGPTGKASAVWSFTGDGAPKAARGMILIAVKGGIPAALYLDSAVIEPAELENVDIGRHVLSIDYGDGQAGSVPVNVEPGSLVVVHVDVAAHTAVAAAPVPLSPSTTPNP